MLEITKQPTATERLQELQVLNQQREELVRRQAVLQAQHQQAVRDMESLKKEMQEAGTSVETLEADLTQAKLVLNQSVAQYQEDLNKFRSSIETAEQNLNT